MSTFGTQSRNQYPYRRPKSVPLSPIEISTLIADRNQYPYRRSKSVPLSPIEISTLIADRNQFPYRRPKSVPLSPTEISSLIARRTYCRQFLTGLKTFEFDRVFGAAATTDDVFEELRPIATAVADGSRAAVPSCRSHAHAQTHAQTDARAHIHTHTHTHTHARTHARTHAHAHTHTHTHTHTRTFALTRARAQVLAYGQTGSGKTYTMVALQRLAVTGPPPAHICAGTKWATPAHICAGTKWVHPCPHLRRDCVQVQQLLGCLAKSTQRHEAVLRLAILEVYNDKARRTHGVLTGYSRGTHRVFTGCSPGTLGYSTPEGYSRVLPAAVQLIDLLDAAEKKLEVAPTTADSVARCVALRTNKQTPLAPLERCAEARRCVVGRAPTGRSCCRPNP
jgi:hypothetical protein